MLPSFEILQAVAKAYNISVDDLRGRGRTKNMAEARQLVAYFLRKINDLSYPAIGRIMERDHTTAIHSYNKISHDVETKPKFRALVDQLTNSFGKAGAVADVDKLESLTPDEITYLNKTLSNDTESKKIPYGFKTSEDILKTNQSIEITEREADILSKYRRGMTLDEIASTINVTRERIRQIAMRTLIKELGQKAQSGFNIDVQEYIDSQKDLHKQFRHLSEDQRREIANKIESGTKIPQILMLYGLSKEKFLEFFPQYEEKAELESVKKKRWSRSYDKCRGCGTVVTPHLRRGYCEACLGGLRKKRREETIQKFGNKCVRCGMSRTDCFRKYKRDFYLTKKLAGESFAPLCRGCFLQLGGTNLANKRWGR